MFAILGSSNRWRSRIMAHNPSTLSHVDCKEEEEDLFSVSPSFSLLSLSLSQRLVPGFIYLF
jgi:hypothetical protein